MAECLHCQINELIRGHLENDDPVDLPDLVAKIMESAAELIVDVAPAEDQATMLAEAGDREEAQREWRLAATAADEIGATRLRAALADLGRRARLGTGVAATAGSPLSILTSRELEVLRSLASGRSNREIASELFISDKTVSVHVSNILAKLHATSRTEAAAIAHDNGMRSRQ